MTASINPYSAPETTASVTPAPKRQSYLHVGLFVSVFALWVTTCILAVTPNNQLYAVGLGNAIALDLFLGVPFAFVVAIISLVKRRLCPSSFLIV